MKSQSNTLKSWRKQMRAAKLYYSNPPSLTREEFREQVSRLQAWSGDGSLIPKSNLRMKS